MCLCKGLSMIWSHVTYHIMCHGCHYVFVITNIMFTVSQVLLLVYIWGIVSQEQISMAGTSNYFPEILWATFLFDVENITQSIHKILLCLILFLLYCQHWWQGIHMTYLSIFFRITSQTLSYICPCACGFILGYIVKTGWFQKTKKCAHCAQFSGYILFGPLTHWGWHKMAAMFQATFSNAFSWMKMFKFRLRFHCSLFPRIKLTIFQHWFR